MLVGIGVFLFLLVFSTFLDYFTGIKIEKSYINKQRKFWFWLSIVVNLGFLGVFKYYNFFATSFTELINGLGFQVNPLLIKSDFASWDFLLYFSRFVLCN